MRFSFGWLRSFQKVSFSIEDCWSKACAGEFRDGLHRFDVAGFGFVERPPVSVYELHPFGFGFSVTIHRSHFDEGQILKSFLPTTRS
jgi:hypothetical protein